MSSQEVVDFVIEKLKDDEKCKKPSIICEEVSCKLKFFNSFLKKFI